MPSLIKSLSLTILAGCLAGPFGWETNAQAQTDKASAKISVPSTRAADKSTQRRTTLPQKTSTKVATAPPGRAPLNDQRPPPPAAKPYRIPKLSPEMEDILIEWEQKSAKINRLEGKFTRVTYDSVFSVELHSKGQYCFEHPDKGSFEQSGIHPTKEGLKSSRGFVLKAGADERWVCDGQSILKINDDEKQYEKVTIPKEDRGVNIRNSPLPFVFGMKADEAKLRYRFELNAAKTDDKQIILRVYPLTQQDLANYKMADVQLNRATCVPMAVKLYDTTGNKEDLYFFSQKAMSINTRTWTQWIGGDPLKPKMNGYKLMVEPVGAAGAKPGTQLAPRPTGRRSAQTPTPGSRTLGTKPLPQRTAQLPEDDEPPARASVKGKSRP